jgi:hypothetical protein
MLQKYFKMFVKMPIIITRVGIYSFLFFISRYPRTDTKKKGGFMNVNATSGSATTVSSAAQEALETAAVTKKEAAKGDQQAIRKLAKEQQQQQQQNPPPTAQPGVGKDVNLLA